MRSSRLVRLSLAPLLPACVAIGCATTSNQTPDVTDVSWHSMEVRSGGHDDVVQSNDVATGVQVRVRGTPAGTMAALNQIYADLKIPIGTMSTEKSQIGNASYRVATHHIAGKWLSDYVDCGRDQTGGSRADGADVTISVLSAAVAVGDSTDVRTFVSGWARPLNESTNSVPCQTTGALEQTINDRLKAVMAKNS